MATMMNRRFLDFSLIVNGTVNTPPATPVPTHGMQYIVGNTPTGAFAGAIKGSIARYDGDSKKWTFTKPRLGLAEVLDVETKAILAWDGSEWAEKISFGDDLMSGEIVTVEAFVTIGPDLPSTADVGERFLNSVDRKIYTATDINVWDDGVPMEWQKEYLATNTCEMCYRVVTNNEAGTEITGEAVSRHSLSIYGKDGTIFVDAKSKNMLVYNKANNVLIPITSSDIHYQINRNAHIVIEKRVISGEEAASKSIELSNEVLEGSENDVELSYGGLSHIPGVDFRVAGKTLSWGGMGLDDPGNGSGIGVEAGEVFIVTYTASPTNKDEEGDESENANP